MANRVRADGAGLRRRGGHESLRTRHFWGIAFGLGLVGVVVAGLQVHLVPMMTDRGLSNDDAGLLLVVLGLASLVGRVVGGFVIDRVHASIVGSIVMLAPIAGLFFLHPPFSSAAIAVAFIGAILIGTLGPYAYPAASEVLSDIAESTANPSATRERL